MSLPQKRYPDSRDPDPVEAGNQFQDFVCSLLTREAIFLQMSTSKLYQYRVGETLQGVEIKLDRRCLETGRLSIEIAEKSRDEESLAWTPSGIYRADNSWLYIQGTYQRVYIFPKRFLVLLHESGKYEDVEFNGTIRRFFLPLEDADKYSARIIEPNWIEGQPFSINGLSDRAWPLGPQETGSLKSSP
jgi:hypothetical protein